MEIKRKSELAWKESNRRALHEFDVVQEKGTLSKLGAIPAVLISGMMRQGSNRDLTANVTRAYETSFLKRAQMLQ
jgi:hypothetical protein